MSRPYIPIALRRSVLKRARGRCEYCLVHQDDAPDTHQLDHIIAVRHGGRTVRGNLACACAVCNHFKGTDFATIDPATGAVVKLFAASGEGLRRCASIRASTKLSIAFLTQLTLANPPRSLQS